MDRQTTDAIEYVHGLINEAAKLKEEKAERDAAFDILRNDLANMTRAFETEQKARRNAQDKLAELSSRPTSTWEEVSKDYAAELKAAERAMRGHISRILALEFECKTKISQLEDARDQVLLMEHENKHAKAVLSENDVLRTKVAMLEADAAKVIHLEAGPRPEVVLLDGLKFSDAPVTGRAKEELFDRLQAGEIRLQTAYAELGQQAARARDAEDKVDQLNEIVTPFRSAGQGNGWIFGLLVEHHANRMRILFTKHEGKPGRWCMVWRGGPKNGVKADSLSELNKKVYAKLLETMEDPFKNLPPEADPVNVCDETKQTPGYKPSATTAEGAEAKHDSLMLGNS